MKPVAIQSAKNPNRPEPPQRATRAHGHLNTMLLFPPGAKLPDGWQSPWVKAGWAVGNCNSEQIPAALSGTGTLALIASQWPGADGAFSSKNIARGLHGVMDGLGAANEEKPAALPQCGGMVRRAEFLALLSSVMSGPEYGCCALMAIQVDQTTTLSSQLKRTAIFDLEEQVSERFAAVLNAEDTVTIWLEFGFGVLVQRETSEEVWALADRICASVASEPFLVAGESRAISVSAGLSLAPKGLPADGAQSWFAAAHAAQGLAFRHGGNCRDGLLTREFEPMAAERVLIIREWLQEAKSGGNVLIEYQPVMPLNSGAADLYLVHAKLRDYRAPLGGVYRHEYLRLARAAGAMVMIDRMSLFHAFEALEQEREQGRSTQLLVPIDIATLKDLPWRWLEAQLRRHRHLADRLILELEADENLLNQDSVKRMVRLRRFGVRIALSDRSADMNRVAIWAKLPADMLMVQFPCVQAGLPGQFQINVSRWRDKGRQLIVDGVEEAGAVTHLTGLGVDYLCGQTLAAIGIRLDYEFAATP